MSDQEGILPVDVDPFGIKNINTKKRNSQPDLFGASDNQSDKENKKQTRPKSLPLPNNRRSTSEKELLTPNHKSSEELNEEAPPLTQEENSLRSSQNFNHQASGEIMLHKQKKTSAKNDNSNEKKEGEAKTSASKKPGSTSKPNQTGSASKPKPTGSASKPKPTGSATKPESSPSNKPTTASISTSNSDKKNEKKNGSTSKPLATSNTVSLAPSENKNGAKRTLNIDQEGSSVTKIVGSSSSSAHTPPPSDDLPAHSAKGDNTESHTEEKVVLIDLPTLENLFATELEKPSDKAQAQEIIKILKANRDREQTSSAINTSSSAAASTNNTNSPEEPTPVLSQEMADPRSINKDELTPEIMKAQEEEKTQLGNNDNSSKQRSNSTATDVVMEDEDNNEQGHRSGSNTETEATPSKAKSQQTPSGSDVHSSAEGNAVKTLPTTSPLPRTTENNSGGEPTPQEGGALTNTGSQEGGEFKKPNTPQKPLTGSKPLTITTPEVDPLSILNTESNSNNGNGEKKAETEGDPSSTEEKEITQERPLGEGLSDLPSKSHPLQPNGDKSLTGDKKDVSKSPLASPKSKEKEKEPLNTGDNSESKEQSKTPPQSQGSRFSWLSPRRIWNDLSAWWSGGNTATRSKLSLKEAARKDTFTKQERAEIREELIDLVNKAQTVEELQTIHNDWVMSKAVAQRRNFTTFTSYTYTQIALIEALRQKATALELGQGLAQISTTDSKETPALPNDTSTTLYRVAKREHAIAKLQNIFDAEHETFGVSKKSRTKFEDTIQYTLNERENIRGNLDKEIQDAKDFESLKQLYQEHSNATYVAKRRPWTYLGSSSCTRTKKDFITSLRNRAAQLANDSKALGSNPTLKANKIQEMLDHEIFSLQHDHHGGISGQTRQQLIAKKQELALPVTEFKRSTL